MATRGKFERLITIPTGGLSVVFTETTGSLDVTATLTAADTYYWSSLGTEANDLAADLAAKLTASSASVGNTLTYTVTVSAGEGGTGKLTVSVSSDTIVLNFGSSSSDLYSLMGFTSGSMAAAASQVSDKHVEALWLPDGFWDNKFGIGDHGWTESNTRSSESASGDVSVIGGGRNKRVESITYRGLSRAKTRTAGETTTNESLETFYENDLRGDKAYCAQPGGPVRWHQDADDDATYVTLKIPGLNRHDPEAMRQSWNGRWNHTFARCVVQS